MFSTDLLQSIIKNIEKASKEKNLDCFCTTRDVFQARIDSFAIKSEKYLQTAIIGEIGNNTFDHNWDFDKNHVRGCYLNLNDSDGTIVLADFGRGVRESLSRVKNFDDDLSAIKTAFLESVSGRAPEQRGNGLKFVSQNIANNGWSLYFQSGTACCTIENGNIDFHSASFTVTGCVAICKFGS